MPKRVSIIHLPRAALHALADGDLAAANAVSPVPLTPAFVGQEWRRVWAMRSRQVVADPPSQAWITGVIWDDERRVAVGRAGFHGPPDGNGMVEVGYAIDPDHRRQGYARAALDALLARAARESGVRVVRASISPENTASLNLIAPFGFRHVGEQWDEDDGRELVFEVAV
ncbi:MAG: GNAT family N-acetyltransferase [Kineosporiaceae bacterium]